MTCNATRAAKLVVGASLFFGPSLFFGVLGVGDPTGFRIGHLVAGIVQLSGFVLIILGIIRCCRKRPANPSRHAQQFEVSERLRTSASRQEVLTGLEEQFKKVSENVQRHGNSLVVKSIEASFGSINRSDTTSVDIRDVEDGFLLVASVNYRPSVAFWIILIITLFTWVFWLIPIVFYLIQKKTVQTGIQEVFTRIKNEFMSSGDSKPKRQEQTDLDQLQKLAQLRDSGVLTEQEFQTKKAQLLGLPPALPSVPRPGVGQPSPPPRPTPPPAADNRTVDCPDCGKAILLRSVKVGRNTCPHCHQVFEAE